MKAMMFVVLMLIGSPAFATPNYTGRWSANVSLNSYEGDGCPTLKDNISFSFRISKIGSSLKLDKFLGTNLKGYSSSTKSPRFKFGGQGNVINNNGEVVYMVYNLSVAISGLKNRTAKIKYNSNLDFDDGTICHLKYSGEANK